MKIAILVMDSREVLHRYGDAEPLFAPVVAVTARRLAEDHGCEIHFVCCTQKPLLAPPKIAENIFYHAVTVPKWGWMRGAYVGCIRALRRKLREIKPDLVHGHGTERYCALAAAYSGFPNVITIHGNVRELAEINQARPFSFDWLAARLEQWTLPRAGGVFCNSAHTQRLVADLARATWIMPNPVREVFLSPPPPGRPGVPPVLLNIGEIIPNKSQIQLLDLAARLRQRGAAFALHFIGRLDERSAYGARFRSRVNQARQEGYASYLGLRSEAELVAAMDGAAGLIHFPKEEAFGLVVAEALARNLKVFGAKVGGLIDVVAGVEGAELFHPDDSDALEVSILKWLSMGNPKITDGAARMRERYHPRVIAQKHLEAYHEVLARRRPPAFRGGGARRGQKI